VKLYPDDLRAPIELADPLPRDANCTRCLLHKNAKTRCIGRLSNTNVEMRPGGLLVVGGTVGSAEEMLGRPFAGSVGNLLQNVLSKLWDEEKRGPVTYDNASRCYPGTGSSRVKLKQEYFDTCRGYLRQTIDDTKPSRILALDPWATYSLLGRSPPPLSVRRGFGWLHTGGVPTPVFMVIPPSAALRNHFLKKWFVEDLEWALNFRPESYWSKDKIVEVTTPALALEAADDLRFGFAFDVETYGKLYNNDFRVLSLAAVANAGASTAWVWDEEALCDPERFGPLRELLSDASVSKDGQNIKYDIESLISDKRIACETNGVGVDTMLIRHLLDADSDADLEILAEQVGMGGHKIEVHLAQKKLIADSRKSIAARKQRVDAAKGLIKKPKKFKADPLPSGVEPMPYKQEKAYVNARVPPEVLLRYNALDTLSTARVAETLSRRLSENVDLSRVWREVMQGAAEAIAYVEAWGVPASKEQMQLLHNMLGPQIREAAERLKAYGDFNPGSNQQVAKLLFDKLKFKPLSKTKSGDRSVDDAALTRLIAQGCGPAADLLEYRRLKKFDGTYAEGMIAHVRSDGRIHPSINLDGARTGRTSCTAPNLQNLPRAKDSNDGKLARDCFIAPPGYVLVEADYSQLELRVLAMLSGDVEMARIFNSGEDYHMATAKLIQPLVWPTMFDITDPMRTAAKTINFSICVAEGQRVLTDIGLVPIEDVKDWHRVWDGVEWVAHEGVVCNGVREVITYDGVTATPDHEVYTDDGDRIQIREAALSVRPRRLAIGGAGDVPVRYSAFDRKGGAAGAEQEVRRGTLLLVPENALAFGGQREGWEDARLHLSDARLPQQVRRFTRHNAWRALRGYGAALSERFSRFVRQVQGARDQGVIQVTGALHTLGASHVPEFAFQEAGFRQDRQQGALLPREPSPSFSERQLAESGALPKMRVYDLVNAGPRHRFTVEGKVVSNCYGKGDQGLADALKIPVEEATKIRTAVMGKFVSARKWIDQRKAAARELGFTRTHWDGKPGRIRQLQHIADPASGIRAQAERQSFNTDVQGTASDYCICSLQRLVKRVRRERMPYEVVLPIHDSLMALVPEREVDSYVGLVREVMTSYETGSVKLEVDVKLGDRWGSLKNYATPKAIQVA
jgi:uracil-DNA glycosylase family 4